MHNKVTMKGISAATLFKLIFIGFICSVGLTLVGVGIASSLGYITLYIGERGFQGWTSLGISLLAAPLVCVILTSVFWFTLGIGLWIWTRFRKIEIQYREF